MSTRNDDNLRRLHTNIREDGYKLPEYEQFVKDMQDDDNLRRLHTNLREDGYKLPEFDVFKTDMFGVPSAVSGANGGTRPHLQPRPGEVVSPVGLHNETKPAGTPDDQAAGTSVEKLVGAPNDITAGAPIDKPAGTTEAPEGTPAGQEAQAPAGNQLRVADKGTEPTVDLNNWQEAVDAQPRPWWMQNFGNFGAEEGSAPEGLHNETKSAGAPDDQAATQEEGENTNAGLRNQRPGGAQWKSDNDGGGLAWDAEGAYIWMEIDGQTMRIPTKMIDAAGGMEKWLEQHSGTPIRVMMSLEETSKYVNVSDVITNHDAGWSYTGARFDEEKLAAENEALMGSDNPYYKALREQYAPYMEELGLDPTNVQHLRWILEGNGQAIDEYFLSGVTDDVLREDERNASKVLSNLAPNGVFLGGDYAPVMIKGALDDIDYNNIERLTDEALAALPKGYRENSLSAYEEYFKEHSRLAEIEGKTPRQMAEESLRGQVMESIINKKLKEVEPKSNLEFFLRKVLQENSFIQLANAFHGNKYQNAINKRALEDYGSKHKGWNMFGAAFGMGFDPAMWVGGPVAKGAINRATKWGAKIFLPKLEKTVAQRVLAGSTLGRGLSSVIGGGISFSIFEGIHAVTDPLEGVFNPDGSLKDLTLGDVASQGVHGLGMGALIGTIAPMLRPVFGRWNMATQNSLGKFGVNSLEYVLSKVIEGTIFALPEIYELRTMSDEDFDAMYGHEYGYAQEKDPKKKAEARRAARVAASWDAWTDSEAMMLAFSIQHGVKSAPKVLGALSNSNVPLKHAFRQLVDRQDPKSFSRDNLAELREKGYGGLVDVLERTRGTGKDAEARPKVSYEIDSEGGVKAVWHNKDKAGEEVDEAENAANYDKLMEVMSDPNISQDVKAKLYFAVTGRGLMPSAVMRMNERVTDDGQTVVVEGLAADGSTVVTSKRFKVGDEKAIRSYKSQVEHSAEINELGRKEQEYAANVSVTVAERAILECAKQEGVSLDEYQRMLLEAQAVPKEERTKEQQSVLERFGSAMRAEEAKWPKLVDMQKESENKKVKLQKALSKPEEKRTEEEKRAVARYKGKLDRFDPNISRSDSRNFERPLVEEQNLEISHQQGQRLAAEGGDVTDLFWSQQELMEALARKLEGRIEGDHMKKDPEIVLRDMELNWENYSDEELQLGRELRAAMAMYNGARGEVSKGYREQYSQRREELSALGNKQEQGMLTVVELKDGRRVYVVDGKVGAREDGTIDKEQTSESLICRDPAGGEETFFVGPGEVAALKARQSVEDALDSEFAVARQELQSRLTGRREYSVGDKMKLSIKDVGLMEGVIESVGRDAANSTDVFVVRFADGTMAEIPVEDAWSYETAARLEEKRRQRGGVSPEEPSSPNGSHNETKGEAPVDKPAEPEEGVSADKPAEAPVDAPAPLEAEMPVDKPVEPEEAAVEATEGNGLRDNPDYFPLLNNEGKVEIVHIVDRGDGKVTVETVDGVRREIDEGSLADERMYAEQFPDHVDKAYRMAEEAQGVRNEELEVRDEVSAPGGLHNETKDNEGSTPLEEPSAGPEEVPAMDARLPVEANAEDIRGVGANDIVDNAQSPAPLTDDISAQGDKNGSALDRLPKDEEGIPDLSRAQDAKEGWAAMVELSDGDVELANENVEGTLEALRKEREALAKKEPTMKRPKLTSNPMKNKELQSAAKAQYEEAKSAWEASVQEIERKIAAFEGISQESVRSKAERMAAERKASQDTGEGAPEWSHDTPTDARGRGFRMVNGHRIERQEAVPVETGKEIAVKFSKDDKPSGHIVLIEADDLQPSHVGGALNPYHFIPEAQPKDRSDKVSVTTAESIARDINPGEVLVGETAYVGRPTINVRGEVIQGNNRSDALKLMWDSHPEQAQIYVEKLKAIAEQLGLSPEQIENMKRPIAVTMVDVNDGDAIRLGQMTAADTESGGEERIRPRHTIEKMGADGVSQFADLLLRGGEEETSIASLVGSNASAALRWLSDRGYISPTQHQSAYNSRGEVRDEAKESLRGILNEALFAGGNEKLPEMFGQLPLAAQKALLATVFRDFKSPEGQKLVPEIQQAIMAYHDLLSDPRFDKAKTMSQALSAVEVWGAQYDMLSGDGTVYSDRYSNFALHLASLFKTGKQNYIKGVMNEMFSLLQGKEGSLLEAPQAPKSLAEAVRQVFEIEYKAKGSERLENDGRKDGHDDGSVLAVDSAPGSPGERGSTSGPGRGERPEEGSGPVDNRGGSGADSPEVGRRAGGNAGRDGERSDNLQPKEIKEATPLSDTEKGELGKPLVKAGDGEKPTGKQIQEPTEAQKARVEELRNKALKVPGITIFEETENGLHVGNKQTHWVISHSDMDYEGGEGLGAEMWQHEQRVAQQEANELLAKGDVEGWHRYNKTPFRGYERAHKDLISRAKGDLQATRLYGEAVLPYFIERAKNNGTYEGAVREIGNKLRREINNVASLVRKLEDDENIESNLLYAERRAQAGKEIAKKYGFDKEAERFEEILSKIKERQEKSAPEGSHNETKAPEDQAASLEKEAPEGLHNETKGETAPIVKPATREEEKPNGLHNETKGEAKEDKTGTKAESLNARYEELDANWKARRQREDEYFMEGGDPDLDVINGLDADGEELTGRQYKDARLQELSEERSRMQEGLFEDLLALSDEELQDIAANNPELWERIKDTVKANRYSSTRLKAGGLTLAEAMGGLEERIRRTESQREMKASWAGATEVAAAPAKKAAPKVKLEDYTKKAEKNEGWPQFTGIHHDEASGMAVATDTILLIGDKRAYDKKKGGKIVAKDGSEIKGTYPALERVIPKESEGIQRVSAEGLRTMAARLRASLKGLPKREADEKTVIVRFADGTMQAYNAQRLAKFLEGMAHIGATELRYGGNRPLWSRSENGVVLLMQARSNSEPGLRMEVDGRRVEPRPKGENMIETMQRVGNAEKARTEGQEGGVDSQDNIRTSSVIKGSEKLSESQDKIEDFGEKIGGARKDALRDFAKTIENTTEQSLVEMPLGKAFKAPNLKKMVESGAVDAADATLAEAVMQSLIYSRTKPRLKSGNKKSEAEVRQWAKEVYAGIQLLGDILSGDASRRERALSRLREQAEAQRQSINEGLVKIRQWNEGRTYDDLPEAIDPVGVMVKVLEALDYRPGEKMDLPLKQISVDRLGRIQVSSGTQNNAYMFGATCGSVEEAVNKMVMAAKLKRGDMDVELPAKNIGVVGKGRILEETGRYLVDYWRNRNIKTKTFGSREEAEAFAREHNGRVSPEQAYGNKYQKYIIRGTNPLTGTKGAIDMEFDSREEAEAWLDAHHDEANAMVLEAIYGAEGVKKERPIFSVDVVYDGARREYAIREANPANPRWPFVRIFATRSDAEKWLADNQERLEREHKERIEKQRKMVYFDTSESPRRGEDYRDGKDATPEMYAETFGFRGVQFGNWTDQADRREAMNQAYDAFMDLAKALGVSPRALSLDGQLGLAFGARGGGNAAAHYEPAQVVINLTKTKGAGSLAHEWLHAVDNFLSRKAGVPLGYASHGHGHEGMNGDVVRAVNALMEAINKSHYGQRSQQRGKYWGENTEMAARLFAEWVNWKLREADTHNAFLSRGVNDSSKDLHQSINYALYRINAEARRQPVMSREEFNKRPESLDGFPYPTREEVEQLSPYMQNLFDTLGERERATGSLGLMVEREDSSVNRGKQDGEAASVFVSMIEDSGVPVRYIRDAEMGERNGRAVLGRVDGDGTVVLNSERLTAETPVHEYTHLWDDMVRRENPELWARGKELMKETPLWEEVMNDPAYADIRHDEDAVASEVHSRLTGADGARLMARMMEEAKKSPGNAMEKAERISAVEKLRSWLKDMFGALKKTLGRWSDRDLRSLTLEDFNRMTVRDLVEGLNPGREVMRGENARSAMSANPMLDDYHTGIRRREDAKTFDEVVEMADHYMKEDGSLAYPDMSVEALREAQRTGYITVYSSNPIKAGAFVSPSRRNAEDYAGGGRVYSARMKVDDIAWIEPDEGEVAFMGERPKEERRTRYAVGRESGVEYGVGGEELEGSASEPRRKMSRTPQGRSLFDWMDGEPKSEEEREAVESGNKANAAIDTYSERFNDYMEQMDCIEKELSSTEDATERAALEAEQEALEDGIIKDKEALTENLKDYYGLNNTPEDADMLALQMANQVQAEITMRRNGRQTLRDIMDEADPKLSEMAAEGNGVVRTAQGDVSYEGFGRLPDAQQGEFAAAERKFTLAGGFSFTGRDKIRDRGDVAYLMSTLEDYSIEHSFVVLVDKDGRPKIVRLGIGSQVGTVVDKSAIRAAYEAFGADKIYFVHNHPSGLLVPSQQDLALERTIREMFKGSLSDGTLTSFEALILDNRSGRFLSFDGDGDHAEHAVPTEGGSSRAEVYAFDGLERRGDSFRTYKIKNSDDVASAINGLRVKPGQGMSYFLLNNNNVIVGHFHSGDTSSLAQEIVGAATRFNARGVILYGDMSLRDGLSRVSAEEIRRLSGGEVTMLDMVSVKKGLHRSAHDEGLMEPGVNYEGSGKTEAREALAQQDKYESKANEDDGVRFRDGDSGEDVLYRLRDDEPPRKTGVGYKVFVLKDGKLYPPMVANPGGESTPVGVWLDADAAPVAGTSKTGRPQVKAGGKGTQGGSGQLAYRPGWHLGEIPYALQFNRKDPLTGQKELFPGNFVWAEVEYANDVDYQNEAMGFGVNPSGKFQHSLAGLPYLPKDGAYRYRTNPNPETDPWIITGAMKVNRVLTPTEVDDMVRSAGREPQRRQEGAISDEQIRALNEEIAKLSGEGREAQTQRDKRAETGEMKARAEAVANKLNLGSDEIEFVESGEGFEGRKARAKGLYDPKTGKITVVVGNHATEADIERTVLHEAVAHKGLRELFGAKFDSFLDNIYEMADKDVKAGIDGMMSESKSRNEATEEYMARLAEDIDYDNPQQQAWWGKVKTAFKQWLKNLGFKVELSDNELRYILWRSHEHLRGADPKAGADLWALAERQAKGEELKRAAEKDAQRGRFAEGREDFDALRDKAVESRGLVMPGLAEKEVDVVRVPLHGFDGDKLLDQAREWAKDHLAGIYTLKDSEGRDVEYTISGKAINKYTSSSATKKSDNIDVHLSALAKLPEVISRSIEAEVHPDYMKGNDGSRGPENGHGEDVLVHRFYGAVEIDGKTYRVKTTLIEKKNQGNKPHSFEVTKIELLDSKESSKMTPTGAQDSSPHGTANIPQNFESRKLSAKKLLEGVEKSYPEADGSKKLLLEESGDEGVRYRDGDADLSGLGNELLPLKDRIRAAKLNIASQNKDDHEAMKSAIKAVGHDLQGIRDAVRARREYDAKTVRDLTLLARQLSRSGLLEEIGQGELQRLLSAVNNGATKKDITKSADKLFDIMVDNQLRMSRKDLDSLVNSKRLNSRVNSQGVVVRGQLDAEAQKALNVFKQTRNLPLDGYDAQGNLLEGTIEARKNAAMNRLSTAMTEVGRRNAAMELQGLMLSERYANTIKASEEEERNLRSEIENAKAQYNAGQMTLDAYRQFVKATQEAIRANRIERVEAYERLQSDFVDFMVDGVRRGQDFVEAERKRVSEIHHNANSDMEGRDGSIHTRGENASQRIANNPLLSLALRPLATFDQMLRMIGNKSVDGRGYLYNRFMSQWTAATEAEFMGFKEATKELDDKASELFGQKMRWSDLYAIERKMEPIHVEFMDGGVMKDHELTPGNALYIYMADKMEDGRMKLRRMGITEDKVEAIKQQLDWRLIELADWLQEEFLTKTRDKYNAVHERIYGAPMDAIDNYFPLKINQRARMDTEDLNAQNQQGQSTPGTTPGGIKKRTRNSLDLDVMNADAFSVVVEHLQEMEHWAAFAEFDRDINTLLNYNRFKNKVINMSSMYGGGEALWNNFKDVCRIASGVYKPEGKNAGVDRMAVNVAKGVTAAKIAFRVYTAAKQLLSYPAYFSEANVVELGKATANPLGSFRWCMENLPMFEKRVRSRMAGDYRLAKTDADYRFWQNRIIEKLSRWGMSPNAFVDAVTVAMGARAIYETKRKRYLKEGYSVSEAERKAKQDASTAYNQTQQSSEGAFLSAMQMDRTVASVALTAFRNASMSYTRQEVDAIRNLSRQLFRKGYRKKSIDFMTKQILREWDPDNEGQWTPQQEARARKAARKRYNRQTFKDMARVAIFGYVMQWAWNLGPYAIYLALGNDDKEKDEMLKDISMHSAFGSIEGLTGGNVVSDGLNALIRDDRQQFTGTGDLLPAMSDLRQAWSHLKNDTWRGVNDIVNLLAQSYVGVNPQTVTDTAVAIYDFCNGDLETAKEATMLAMRILEVPQSQIDKLYFDEIQTDGATARSMTPQQIAERYARFKTLRNAPLTGWLRSEEEKQELLSKEEKKVLADAKKRLKGETFGMNDAEILRLASGQGNYEEVKEELKALRSQAKEAKDSGDYDTYYDARMAIRDIEESAKGRDYKTIQKMNSKIGKLVKKWCQTTSPQEMLEIEQELKATYLEAIEEMDSGDS